MKVSTVTRHDFDAMENSLSCARSQQVVKVFAGDDSLQRANRWAKDNEVPQRPGWDGVNYPWFSVETMVAET